MNDKIIFSAIAGIFSTVILGLLALHGYGQSPQGLDVLTALTGSEFNSSTQIVSWIPNVTITKFEILSPKSIGLDIKYSGTGKSPAVKVDSSAVLINSKFQEMVNQINTAFNSSNSTGLNATESTAALVTKLDQIGDVLSLNNGTKALAEGWKSPNSLVIKLKGNATLDHAQFIGVIVR